MSKRGSYKSLTTEQKIEVLKCIDKRDSVQSVLRDFGISKSTFYDTKKSRSAITNFSLNRDFDSASEIKRKQMTPAKTSDIDEAVWTWYKQQREMCIRDRYYRNSELVKSKLTKFHCISLVVSQRFCKKNYEKYISLGP